MRLIAISLWIYLFSPRPHLHVVFLPVADGISHTQYLKLEKILGPTYSQRIISSENVINDFLVRRTSREVAAQVEVLALARQRVLELLSKVVPGETTARDAHARVLYSAVSDRTESNSRDYVLQRGDLFYSGADAGGTYMDFDIDTKTYAYISRDGETEVPQFIQEVYDLAIAGQWIMRPHMKVGMTGGESLAAMVKAIPVKRCIPILLSIGFLISLKAVFKMLVDVLKISAGKDTKLPTGHLRKALMD